MPGQHVQRELLTVFKETFISASPSKEPSEQLTVSHLVSPLALAASFSYTSATGSKEMILFLRNRHGAARGRTPFIRADVENHVDAVQ